MVTMWSIVIPTYNRLPILQKCLQAMEAQNFTQPYEIVVVDDGSTDGTVEFLQSHADEFPHVRLFLQNHEGAAIARNTGIDLAQGDTIVFIDSDLVVTPVFLSAHAKALAKASKIGDRAFTYGLVINTSNFENPSSEPLKITDISQAFFATGNVAIAKHWLIEAGKFDTSFRQYGWEDLELGVRLKKLGLKLIKCPEAVGYHWHPAFTIEQLPRLVDVEAQRGRMGVVFYQKHPTWEVKLMIQMTWLHVLLWGTLSLGGLLNERSLRPLLKWLIDQGKPQLALEIARIFLNWYNVKGVYAAYRESIN
ncbi:glycosyltransferase family 2 protein [Pseudanabaena galeata]|jgi:glycosyltransferase involved in cell wall biosynthesis|uniref:glycosyltransferase family 2 protein n=1 Tax=Pseudanabaena TaxID=1152 RepID=UPI002479774D|nr:glycosyltransferase [Pseudanabaena galeata]WGS70997.1 glycosyltransferase [Pseudanabaena galeata CCNP1313]